MQFFFNMSIGLTYNYAIISEDANCVELIRKILVEENNWQCCFHYPSLESFILSGESAGRVQFLLLDIHLTGLSGELCVEIFKRILPSQSKIVALGHEASSDTLTKVLKRGADGLLTKAGIDDQLGKQLLGIRKHGVLLSPDMTEKLIRKLFVESQAYQEPGLLSPVEWDILYRLAEGDTYERAAKQLGLKLNNFRYHIKKLFKTLNVDSSTAAVSWYHKRVSEKNALHPVTM